MRNKKEIAAGFALFVAGGLTVWLFDHAIITKKKPFAGDDPQALLNGFFNQDQIDPFERMRQMQQQMNDSFLQQQSGAMPSHRTGGEISQREDDKFFYYDVDLGDGTFKEMQANVRGGQIQINGRLESTHDESGMTASFSSIFSQSLPIPPGVDGEKFRMNQEEKKLVISFPKLKD